MSEPYQPPLNRPTTAEEAVGFAPASEIVQAELAEPAAPRSPKRQRRIVLPLVLFLLTCASTFFAGATYWMPGEFLALGLGSLGVEPDPYFLLPARRAVLSNWREGLTYMGCMLAILLTHEMGHFLTAVIHRVRASLPYFIPLPIHPLGTIGAVIGLDGSQADRRQIFDIGIAGPLAGLAVAIPVIWIGASRLDVKVAEPGELALDLPLAMRLVVDYVQPGMYNPAVGVPMTSANAFFMAGWVGLLVTALNMMPVSQLDGGHVSYALFGRSAHWFARLFMLATFTYMAFAAVMWRTLPAGLLMAILVLLMGVDHPPTRNDSVKLGWFRIALGLVSLLIPIFCFVPNPIRQVP